MVIDEYGIVADDLSLGCAPASGVYTYNSVNASYQTRRTNTDYRRKTIHIPAATINVYNSRDILPTPIDTNLL